MKLCVGEEKIWGEEQPAQDCSREMVRFEIRHPNKYSLGSEIGFDHLGFGFR
jgi:hypothetical protein